MRHAVNMFTRTSFQHFFFYHDYYFALDRVLGASQLTSQFSLEMQERFIRDHSTKQVF